MKNINLLTASYKERAELYRETKLLTTAMAVVFLFWILIVSSSILITSLMRSFIYSNESTLSAPEALEAERLHSLAAEVVIHNQRAEHFVVPENISMQYLSALMAEAGGITISEFIVDAGERSIFVTASTGSEIMLTGFVARLNENLYFAEVNVTEMTARPHSIEFVLELRLGD